MGGGGAEPAEPVFELDPPCVGGTPVGLVITGPSKGPPGEFALPPLAFDVFPKLLGCVFMPIEGFWPGIVCPGRPPGGCG